MSSPVPPRRSPPRFASWLATRRVPPADREFLLGDLDEDFHHVIVPARGHRAAVWWYWGQAFRCLALSRRTLEPERERRARGVVMQSVWKDIRFAVRLLWRTPGFTATAVLTLALGVGATTAIFSVVDAVLLAPLPFADADRIVVARGGPRIEDSTPVSYPAFLETRDAGVFETTAAAFYWGASISGDGDPEQLSGLRTSASLFDVLGIRPLQGALFRPEDEPRAAAPVVLIGEGLWRRRFAGAADVVGRRVVLNGLTFTIVGVLPSAFRLRPSDDPPDIVAPLRLTEQNAPASLNFISLLCKLKPGQTPDSARDRLQAVVRGLHPAAQPPPSVTVAPLRTIVAGDSPRVLWALFGAVVLLLAIACANLANLLLARATVRRREISVRLALGAGRGRVVRQLLTESVVLAGVGGAAGVGLAWLGVTFAAQLDAVRATGAFDVRLNLTVLAFAAGTSFVAGVLFGLVPATDAGRQSMRSAIGDGGRVAGGRSFVGAALVSAEVALTLILLVGSGLLIRSFANLVDVDKGFDPDRVVSFRLTAPAAKYPSAQAMTQFFQTVMTDLAHVPNVRSVGLVSELPLGGGGTNGTVTIEGRTFPPGQEPNAEKRIVSPEYFRTLGIRVLQGRGFSEQDRAGAAPVIVISEAFARKYFPNENPIGKRAAFNWDFDGVQDIIGVVADVKHYALDDQPQSAVYVSTLQRPLDSGVIAVKLTGETGGFMTEARAVVRRIDPDRPPSAAASMDAMVQGSVATRRFTLWLVAGFSAIGLVLAATGIYGVVAYTARQRTREFGIRLALGAAAGQVLGLVIRQGALPVIAGVVIGIGGAFGLTGLIRAQLFGVQPTDPLTFLIVAVGLVAIAFVACYVPARRATRISPASILRSE